MLRTPAELSDGQRYRFRLALGLSKKPRWIVADEFTATLDRTLARVIAFNIRRLADRTGTGFLLATTHEDVIEDLDPDVHVRCRLDGEVSVERTSGDEGSSHADGCTLRESDAPAEPHRIEDVFSDPTRREPGPAGSPRKKKEPSRLHKISGSARRPSATGRTSLGGIIAATTSG